MSDGKKKNKGHGKELKVKKSKQESKERKKEKREARERKVNQFTCLGWEKRKGEKE